MAGRLQGARRGLALHPSKAPETRGSSPSTSWAGCPGNGREGQHPAVALRLGTWRLRGGRCRHGRDPRLRPEDRRGRPRWPRHTPSGRRVSGSPSTGTWDDLSRRAIEGSRPADWLGPEPSSRVQRFGRIGRWLPWIRRSRLHRFVAIVFIPRGIARAGYIRPGQRSAPIPHRLGAHEVR